MDSCRTVTEDMLSNAVKLRIEGESVDFKRAKTDAFEKAKEIASDPMLLAWYDKKTGRYFPDVECCGEEKPSWMIYAESRGGDIVIDINNGEYVFMYTDFHGAAD